MSGESAGKSAENQKLCFITIKIKKMKKQRKREVSSAEKRFNSFRMENHMSPTLASSARFRAKLNPYGIIASSEMLQKNS